MTSSIVAPRLGSLTHQQRLLGLQLRRRQGLLQMVSDQEATHRRGTLTHLALEVLELFWSRPQLGALLHLLALIEKRLCLSGVIAILAGQTRVMAHVNAPLGESVWGSIIGDSGVLAALFCRFYPWRHLGTHPTERWQHAQSTMQAES